MRFINCVTALLVLGCASPDLPTQRALVEDRLESTDPGTPDTARDAARRVRAVLDALEFANQSSADERVVGHSVEGRPITYHVLGNGPETIMLCATIHGDEAAGTPLLERLVRHLASYPSLLAGRRLVVVPVVNPDGFAASHRHNARGIDLNRNFPSRNRRDGGTHGTALSEPEARALESLLREFEPDLLVSIHGWVGLVDWDGPAEPMAAVMGDLCDLPRRRIGSRPGSLGSYVGVDAGVPTITLEMPGSSRRMDADALWDRFGPALLATLSPTP